MFVRTRQDVVASGHELDISHGNAVSTRYLTKRDGLGFSFSAVVMEPGQEAMLWYQHHWEANFITAGEGELEELATGRKWPLEPGTIYVVGPSDRHQIRAITQLRLVSVFNPPIVGDENHDAEGGFPPSGPLPAGPPDG
jgi:L-ectoine synthase